MDKRKRMALRLAAQHNRRRYRREPVYLWHELRLGGPGPKMDQRNHGYLAAT